MRHLQSHHAQQCWTLVRKAVLGGVLLASAAPAWASETTTYTYDALGRLIDASRTGTVNNGVDTTTSYDPAGNRLTYATIGSGALVIVVPLNGFTIIPIPVDQ